MSDTSARRVRALKARVRRGHEQHRRALARSSDPARGQRARRALRGARLRPRAAALRRARRSTRRTSRASCSRCTAATSARPEARTGASALLVMAEHSGTHIDALCHQAYERPPARRARGHPARADLDRLHGARDRHGRADRPPRRAARRRRRSARCRPATRSPRPTSSAPPRVELRPGRRRARAARLGRAVGRPRRLPGGGRDRRPTPRAGSPSGARSPSAPTTSRGTSRTTTIPELGSLPGHTILIVQEGIHIIESLFLEELAADGVREFGVRLPAAEAARRDGLAGAPDRARLSRTLLN